MRSNNRFRNSAILRNYEKKFVYFKKCSEFILRTDGSELREICSSLILCEKLKITNPKLIFVLNGATLNIQFEFFFTDFFIDQEHFS